MHVIRLRGMWRLETIATFGLTPQGDWTAHECAAGVPTILHEPAAWTTALDREARGRFRLSRRFHAPTGITTGDQVSLVFEHHGLAGQVVLDGQSLGEFDSTRSDRPLVFAQDIREHLKRNHELAMVVEWLPAQHHAPLFGTVRLEITPVSLAPET